MNLVYKGVNYTTTKNRAFIAIPLRTSLKLARYDNELQKKGFNEINCLTIFNNHYDLAVKMEQNGLESIFVFERKYEKDKKHFYFLIKKHTIDEGIKNDEVGFIKSNMKNVYSNVSSNNCKPIDINDKVCKNLLQTLFYNFNNTKYLKEGK